MKTLSFYFCLFQTFLFFGQAVYNGSNKHTFTTNHGTIEIGPFNGSWGHIYTDRPKIIFNKDVYTITNAFSSYNNDLIFKTKGTERMRINDDTGRVGIGTTSPSDELHVVGPGRTGIRLGGPTTSSGAVADLEFRPSNGGNVGGANYWIWSFRTDSWSNTPGDLALYSHNGSSYTSPLIVQADGDVALVSGKNAPRKGNVGIGTLNPDSKLTVNGNIHAEEVKVDLNVPGPDYVFKEGYDLKSLEEVQNHINEHGHLPNIPSAKEMEANGIKVGEMNMKLLEKIEELTLYTLQQENIIEQLLKNNSNLIQNQKESDIRMERMEQTLKKIVYAQEN